MAFAARGDNNGLISLAGATIAEAWGGSAERRISLTRCHDTDFGSVTPGTEPVSPSYSPAPAGAAATARVTYRMTDQMGVVYYGHYFELFEIGRAELMRAAGLSYRQMERDGYLLPVVHAAADYRAPARYDDLLSIHVRIERLTRVRIHFAYEITRQGEAEVLCRGVTQHAVIGSDGRPRRFEPAWMERLTQCKSRAC